MGSRKKILSDEELKWFADHIWDNWESEDGLDNEESDSEPDFEPDYSENTDFLDHLNLDNIPIQFDDGIMITDNIDMNYEAGPSLQEHSEAENIVQETKDSDDETLAEIARKLSKEKDTKNILWKKKNLVIDENATSFRGNAQLPSEIMELSTPYSFFKYFFTDQLITYIVEQSNLFSIQVDPSKPANITENELRRYLGVCLYMSVVHMPNLRSYWGRNLGFSQIKEAMSEKKFEKVRRFLHFNDNSNMLPRDHTDCDKLHKIRPVVDALLSRFQNIPIECHLSLDEQICASKGRHSLKQYLPAKPHKWGMKLFVLAGVSGFVYNFEVYTGKGRANEEFVDDEVDIGATGNIVQKLCRIVPSNQNHIVYFDNFYTSLPLVTTLARRGILSLGTVRRNRIPKCKLPPEKEMNKQERGSSCEYVCTNDGVDVSCVSWKDNKTVCLLSSYTGELPKTTIPRYDRKQKKKIDINCPNVVVEYNRHMGGVDLMNSLIGRYKIKIRSKKWYIRLFYHLLDQTVVNSWLLYRRQKQQSGETSNIMKLADFRTEVAMCLCKMGSETTPRRGRPSDLEREIQKKKQRSVTTSYVPPKDVRMDETSHWPSYDSSRQRCKLPTCKSFSFIKCMKCGLHFCLNKNKNCFVKFHTT